METCTVGIIIPTLNAQDEIGELLELLKNQTRSLDEILVIDSSSDDDTASIVESFEDVRLISIERRDFNHGLTRDLGMRTLQSDFILFLTQDALPVSERYVESLIRPMLEFDDIAMSSGRQLPKKDARRFEQLVRSYNYSAASVVRSLEDVSMMGIKAFFVSDACSAYRREAYIACGGFDEVATNEDMLMAAKFMRDGMRVAYAADAEVYHSHNLGFREQYDRNYAIGAFLESHKDDLCNAAVTSSGKDLAKHVFSELWKERNMREMSAFFLDCIARLAGNASGRRHAASAVASKGKRR